MQVCSRLSRRKVPLVAILRDLATTLHPTWRQGCLPTAIELKWARLLHRLELRDRAEARGVEEEEEEQQQGGSTKPAVAPAVQELELAVMPQR